jgi:hypothetical protein
MKVVEIANGISVNVEMITFVEKYNGRSSKIKSLVGINHLIGGIECSIARIIESSVDYDELIKKIIE